MPSSITPMRSPRPSTARPTWIKPAPDAPALREKVEALLRAHDEAGSSLDHHPPAFPPTTGYSLAEGARHAVIGPYKLLQQIGEGGMGVVYMAEQDRAGPPHGRAEDHQARHGQPPGHRPLRGRAAGPGHDGPPQHRQGPRRRHDRQRPALLRHGAGQGRPDHRVSATTTS